MNFWSGSCEEANMIEETEVDYLAVSELLLVFVEELTLLLGL